MKPDYNLLYTLGFTDDQITAAYDVSYAELRRTLINCPEELSEGAAQELLYTRADEASRAQLAKEYKTTVAQVDKALYRVESIFNQYTEHDVVEAWLTKDVSIERLAKQFRIAKARVLQILCNMGVVNRDTERKLTLKDKVVASLLLGCDYDIIADTLACPVSTVYKYASEEGLANPQVHIILSQLEWNELLAKHKNGESISSLSREYGVSRAAIYARKAKLVKEVSGE